MNIMSSRLDNIENDVKMILEEQKDTNAIIQVMVQQIDKMILSHT